MAPIDTKVVQAQIAVTLGQKRRLISSWLPPMTPEEQLASQRSEDDLLQEEAKLFLPTPPTLGVGYVLSNEASLNLRSNDGVLRQRILGKRAHSRVPVAQPKELYTRKKARLSESESDDEVLDNGGRGSLGKRLQKSKRQRRMSSTEEDHMIDVDEREQVVDVNLDKGSGPFTPTSELTRITDIDNDAEDFNSEPLTLISQVNTDAEPSGFLKSTSSTENDPSQTEKKRKKKKKKKQADIPGNENTVIVAHSSTSTSSSQIHALELMDGSVVMSQNSSIPSLEKIKKKRNRKKKNKNKNNSMATTSEPVDEISQPTEESGSE